MKKIYAIPGKSLSLGRLGENERTQIVFPVTDWLEEYPDASIVLFNKRPKETQEYPVVITGPENGEVFWTVENTELAIDGDGECMLQIMEDSVVAKSANWRTKILPALTGADDPPEPWESLMDDMAELVGQAQDAAEDATDSAEDAAESAAAAETAGAEAGATAGAAAGATAGASAGAAAAANLIDDTAGAGDTDKAWSADKLTNEFGSIATATEFVNRFYFNLGPTQATTVNGLTYSIDNDNTLTLNGTPSANVYFQIMGGDRKTNVRNISAGRPIIVRRELVSGTENGFPVFRNTYNYNTSNEGTAVEVDHPFVPTSDGCLFIRVKTETSFTNAKYRFSVTDGAVLYPITDHEKSAVDYKLRNQIELSIKNKLLFDSEFKSKSRMLFSAHRGAEGQAPYGSYPSYELACKQGWDLIQISRARQSSDGTWYCLHDETVDAQTNGTGAIANLTDEYIATIYQDDGVNVGEYQQNELRLPTLESVIQLAYRYGIMVSIRMGSLPALDGLGNISEAWTSFINLCNKYKPERMMFSGTLDQVIALKALTPNWHGQVYVTTNSVQSTLNTLVSYGYTNISILTERSYLTDEIISNIHNAGYYVGTVQIENPTFSDFVALSDRHIDFAQTGISSIHSLSHVSNAVIDDTAGVGDTDKTYSADKLATDHSVLLNAINGKADIENTPKVSGSDAENVDLDVTDPDGNVIVRLSDGHIETKNFNSRNSTALMEDNTDDDLNITDSFGNVVARFTDGHIKTKNFDSSEFVNVPDDVETLQGDVEDLQNATTGILYRTKHQTDGVYASCRYNHADKQFCLLIAGDSHTNPQNVVSMFEYFNAINAFNAGIMLGDMSGNTYADSIEHYTTPLATVNKPFLTVLGNHDVAGATSDTDLYTKYGGCFQYADLASGEAVSGKCYYYKDFSTFKIRIIVLMQYDLAGRSVDDGHLCFGQDQIDWFISTLNSTPSDYGVIIAEHTNPGRYMDYEMDSVYTSSTWAQSNYAPTYMDDDPVPDIVNAWINGTSLSQTYSYTFENPPSALSVNADFTSRGDGEFISYFGGHWHQNVFGYAKDRSDQPDFHVQAAGINTASGDIPRRAGTASEDSFCAVAIDRDKKAVKVFQIGAHYTMDAVDRQYFKYEYGA